VLEATLLLADEHELRKIRAAQIAVAWLPGSLPLVLHALEVSDNEAKFAILCSLTDATKDSLRKCRHPLIPAIWRAVVSSGDGAVDYIGAKALARFEPRAVWDELESINLADGSTLFVEQLKEHVKLDLKSATRLDAILSERRQQEL
jgi:hypothetical protein